jgi:hypothetical protein
MKKCQYCAELIDDNSKICKYCNEELPTNKISKLPPIRQNPLAIKATVFIILSRSILVFCLFISTAPVYTILWLILDIFFSYHLLKMREWARRWIIGLTIFRMVSLTFAYFPKGEYIAWSIDIPMLVCILILLYGSSNKKKTIITTSTYSILLICLVGANIFGVFNEKQTKNIITNSPLIMEQGCEKGFKIILPSDSWRFIKKEDGKKLLGEIGGNADIIIADTSGKVYGSFLGEDLSKIDISKLDMQLLIDDFKKDLGKDYEVLNEYKASDGIAVELKYEQNGAEYEWLHFYKVLGNTGVIGNFMGASSQYNKLQQEMTSLISKIKEISKKQFLKKMSSQEMYKKYSDAVVLIRVYNKEGELVAFSSGFNVLDSGAIVTNLHAIMPGYYLDVKFPYHGVYENVYIAAISKKLNDLIILTLNGKELPCVNLDDSMELEIGDKVVTIGNPEGLVNSLSEGIVSGLRNIGGYLYYQITAPISSGSSGGAVFNEFGSIAGISTKTLEEGQNLNFCIPINELSDMTYFKEPIALAQFQEILKKEGNEK